MMGSENHHDHKDEMESLLLDDDDTSFNNNTINGTKSSSFSNYRSATLSLSDTHHPLASSPIVSSSDLLFSATSPPPSRNLRNPNGVVVFNPLDGESNGVESPSSDLSSSFSFSLSRSPSSSSSAATTSDYFKITVPNSQKEQESMSSVIPGGNAYVTYLITNRTNILEFGGSEFVVRRRFRDMVMLSNRLSESYRGFFIPPRPDKNVLESQVMQKLEFVENRRVVVRVV